jgi:hypothetical protein
MTGWKPCSLGTLSSLRELESIERSAAGVPTW